jgi:RNA polymerase sigma-70 factor (ECF subfamily)
MPWDFWLFFAFLGVVIPLRGRSRLRHLLALPRVGRREKIILYATTTAFQWALTLLDQVFAHLREECAAAGKAELFEALGIYLSGEKSTASYADVAPRLNMTAGSVQVAVHRLRRRYGELLRAEIAHTVSRPEEIDEEIRHLFAALRG